MLYTNRRYVIFNRTELHLIDFTQVLETSSETLRSSIDNEKTFVKYEGEMPQSLQALTTASQPYTHDEILGILNTSEWQLEIEL